MTSEFCRISGSRRSRQKLQNPSEYVELEEFDASLRNRIGWTVGPGQVSHQVVAWLGKYLRWCSTVLWYRVLWKPSEFLRIWLPSNGSWLQTWVPHISYHTGKGFDSRFAQLILLWGRMFKAKPIPGTLYSTNISTSTIFIRSFAQ